MLPEPMPETELLLTKDEAMNLVAQYNRHYDNLVAVVLRMWNGRADLALGCDSWDSFASRFLNGYKLPKLERKQVHQELAQAGMSTRAISSVTGAGQTTVVRDLTPEPNGSPAPAPVTGLDGKVYSPIRLVPPPPPADAVVEAIETTNNLNRDLTKHEISEANRMYADLKTLVKQYETKGASLIAHLPEKKQKEWAHLVARLKLPIRVN